jgi:hypothetical protein
MTDNSSFDNRYGGAQRKALDALGPPPHFYHCQAVLLGCGGADGLWMRLLGSKAKDFHRVGSLVVTPQGIAYAEKCATTRRPKSNAGMILRGMRSAESSFTHFVWSAPASEIATTNIEPAVDSPYEAYVAATIEVGGEAFRFGIDVGSPSGTYCLCALRDLGGTSLGAERTSTREPRTDGAYVVARTNKPDHQLRALYFEDNRVCFFSTYSLQDSMQSLISGESTMKLNPYERRGGCHHIAERDMWLTVLDDDRLVFYTHDADAGHFSSPYYEMTFVTDAEIAGGWGTKRKGVTESPWPPVLTPNGRPIAPDIG